MAMTRAIECNVLLDPSQVIGTDEPTVQKYLNDVVTPAIIASLSNRPRGGEVGCSVHAGEGGAGGECHVSIHF